MENIVLNERYQIECKLGAGGLGEVYLARDHFDRRNPRLTRPVAVKVLHANANNYARSKFEHEKEALSRIRHPYVVGVLDAGELADGRPWFVMEYVEGLSLREAMARFQRGGPEARFELAGRWLRQLGQALSAAHAVGVIHRDLKPENVMLARVAEGEYQVKLIDFGIAKVEQSAYDATTFGMVAGTMLYMSPEQIVGEAVTPASDVYTLGVVAYEMLTGRMPFAATEGGKALQLLRLQEQQMRGAFRSPKEINAEIPTAASDLVCQALAYKPERRPASARLFGEELERLLIGGRATMTEEEADGKHDVKAELKTPPSEQTFELREPGGALGLESRLYIVREADRDVHQAVHRGDSIVLIKGARQMGKTSLLARGVQEARRSVTGVTVALTDFQKLSEGELASAGSFLKALGGLLADALDINADPETGWQERRGAAINFERFLKREILARVTGQLVWGMDEVDRLFGRAYASEVFGLFRSWHNERALEPECPWRRLTLLMAYATEAHLLIADMNQSPFNVGTRVEVSDFSFEQVAELNQRYGAPLEPEVLGLFYELIGGHPYLAQKGLYEVAKHRYTPEGLLARSDADDGPYGEHLRRLWSSIKHDQALEEGVRRVLEGSGKGMAAEVFYRLRSGGVVLGEKPERARLRCRLYERYLGRQVGKEG